MTPVSPMGRQGRVKIHLELDFVAVRLRGAWRWESIESREKEPVREMQPKIHRVAILVALALSIAFDGALAAGVNKSEGPRAEIEPEEFDFGSVHQDEKMVHEFTVRNTGTAELEIRRIATSCGCTAALTSDRSIAPGASTILRVTLETRKYKGVVEKSVSIATNDRDRVHTVRIKAFVEAPE